MLWQTLHQLKSKDPGTRRKAVDQLCQKPNERAGKVLVMALKDEDAEVRRLAAIALGKLEQDQRFGPLIEALRDRDAGVLQAASAALKKANPEEALPALKPLLRHPDTGVRGQVAQTMELLGWRPSEPADEIWFRVAKAQFFQAAAFGAEAVPALETALQSGSSGVGVGAVEALGHINDPRAVKPLMSALRSPDPSICIAAVSAVTRLGIADAADTLVGLLRHRNPQVRSVSVEGLGRLQALEAVDALCEMLQDAVWEVRREAAETLGKLRDVRAVEPLTGALADSDADVREAAVIALGTLRDPRAIGPLVRSLRDPNSSVRRITAATLSRIDTDWSSFPEARAAAEELKPALQDNDPGVRHFVGHLLAAMSNTRSAPVPPASGGELMPEQRRQLAVQCLLQILTDWDRDLRQAAAEALGHLADPSAQAALVRAQMDPDPGVRVAVEEALRSFSA
jgi:HEAT repeat protein